MDNRIKFFIQVRSNIDYILNEIAKISGSPIIKKMVMVLCEKILSNVLGNIDKIQDEKLIIRLMMYIEQFDLIIKTIENSEEDSMTNMLLITHLADIIHLIQTNYPELVEKYKEI